MAAMTGDVGTARKFQPTLCRGMKCKVLGQLARSFLHGVPGWPAAITKVLDGPSKGTYRPRDSIARTQGGAHEIQKIEVLFRNYLIRCAGDRVEYNSLLPPYVPTQKLKLQPLAIPL